MGDAEVMDVATLRRVDRWVGVPLCAILTAVRRLSAPFAGSPGSPTRRLAFIKLAEQGSTVIACDALQRAIEMVGRENVHFVAFEENRFILDVMDVIPAENVITIRTGGLLDTGLQTLAAIARLRRLGIDTVVDLEFFARSSAVLGFLSGARRRVGFHPFGGEGPYRGDLMTHRLRFNPHLHTSQTFRLLVEALHAPLDLLPTFDLLPLFSDQEPPRFAPASGETAHVRQLLRRAAGGDALRPLVLLNPNCSDRIPLRAWPSERYVELARRLIERYPEVRVGLSGAPAEAPAIGDLVRQIGSDRCFSLAGHTTLRELLVVYTLADLLVTNDSGPAHFAALTDIDVITLFGPEHPKLFAARTPRNHVIWAGIACSPCISALNNRTSACANNLCMQNIGVDGVLAKACELLDARLTGGRPHSESRRVPQPASTT